MLGPLLTWLLAVAHQPAASVAIVRQPGTEACDDASATAERVNVILRRQALDATDAAQRLIRIEVTYERSADGVLVATVHSRGRKAGQRVLRDRSATCGALSEAVGVAIALLLDSAAHDETEAAPDAEARPPAAAPTAAATSSASADDARQAPRRGWQARVALGAGGGYGLSGSAAPVGNAHVGIASGGVRLELGALASLPSSTAYGAGEVRTSLLFGDVRACYLLGRAFTLGPCAVFGVGRLRGDGHGFDKPLQSNLLWTAGGLGLAGEAALGSFFYGTAGATLWVPLRRQTFSVENAGIAWESKPIAGVLAVGLGARLF